MLTEKETNLVKHFAQEVSDNCWFPFDWKNGELRPTQSKLKVVLVYLNFIFSCCHFVFISLRLSPKFGGGLTLTSLPFHGFSWIIHILYISFHVHMFIYTTEVATLLNRLLSFNKTLGISRFGNPFLEPNRREVVVCFLRRWINGVATSIAAIFIFQPTNVYFLYSLVAPCYQSIGLQILFFPIEAYLVAYKVMIFHLFVIFLGFFYVVTTNFWVNKVCIEWSVSESCEEVIENLKIYRLLTLLNSLYNSSFASLVIPAFKALIEMAVVLCTYGCIRLYNKIPVNTYIMLPGLASFLFVEHQFAVDRMANVHDNSSKLQENYCRNSLTMSLKINFSEDKMRDVKYIRSYLRSCRPLRCQLTQALFVEKSTRLVLLNMLLNLVVTLLLSDKKSSAEVKIEF